MLLDRLVIEAVEVISFHPASHYVAEVGQRVSGFQKAFS